MATDGKWAESQVQNTLRSLSKEFESFGWQRLYDSHSAKSYIPNQVGDFLFFAPKFHGVIEVKETQAESSITRDNFGDQQLALMRERTKCGGQVWAVVFSTTTKNWYSISYTNLAKALREKKVVDLEKWGEVHGNVLDAVFLVLEESL